MFILKDILMKRIKPEDLTTILTDDMLYVLAQMADEVPQSKEWHEIFDLLSQTDYRRVMDKKLELQKEREKERLAHMTDEEKTIEEAKWKKIKEDTDPFKFYGNMGQPETAQEFKNRYGVWPPGYDGNGNKNI